MMRFEWDPKKEQKNIRKHGIDFKTAIQVWKDPHYDLIQDRIVSGEERWQIIGYVGATLLLVVAHAYKEIDDNEIVDIISAREAEPWERKRHAEKS